MERLFSTGWKVEAPPDISMPVCLKANFTLHAPGTKPSKNLHFNRIPPPIHWLFLESGAPLLHPISYFIPWMHNHFCVNYCHCIVIRKRGSGEGKEGSWGRGGGVFFQSYFREFLLIVESCIMHFIFFQRMCAVGFFHASFLIRRKITGATRQQSLLLNAALITPDKDFH